MSELNKLEIETLLSELIVDQKNKLLACGRRIVPQVTLDDLLQPNDYLELELNPHFRFEEGVLIGIQTVQTALRAAFADARNSKDN